MNAQRLVKTHRDCILEIATSHGATRVRLFGSVADGSANEGSDVDFLVTMKPGSSLLDLIAIKQDLEDLLDCSVDVVTERSLSPYFRDDVFQKAVNL